MIALLPVFPDIMRETELERALPKFSTDQASVHFVFAAQRFVPVNVRAFIDLALEAV